MAKIDLKNPGRPLDIIANTATAAGSRNPNNIMSTHPEIIIFYSTGKGLYLRNLYILCYIYETKNRSIMPICTI